MFSADCTLSANQKLKDVNSLVFMNIREFGQHQTSVSCDLEQTAQQGSVGQQTKEFEMEHVRGQNQGTYVGEMRKNELL